MTPKILKPKTWGQLRCASGTAEHMPNAIISLLSANKAERHDARFAIDNEAVRQSDRYEAVAYVIEPLAEALLGQPISGREEIYQVLIEIADGTDMPGELAALVTGENISLSQACQLELERFRYLFERDKEDKKIGHLAAELIVSMDKCD